MGEIQRLMGALCFVRRPGASPYADLMAASLWSDVAREFSRQCCGLLGQVGQALPLNFYVLQTWWNRVLLCWLVLPYADLMAPSLWSDVPSHPVSQAA